MRLAIETDAPRIATPRDVRSVVRRPVETGTSSEGYELVRLNSPDGLTAAFAPQVGMTCYSLVHAGTELVGERYGLTAYARGGATMGMSLMHPWADRLSRWSYTAGGTTVRLPVSPLLHTDAFGLPVNGVHPDHRAWVVEPETNAEVGQLAASLEFGRPRQLELFPFPHRLLLHAELRGRCLQIEFELVATGRVPVPVCFGYRIYLAREPHMIVVLPGRRRIVTDPMLLPTGATEAAPMRALTAGIDELSEVSHLGTDRCVTVASARRRVTIEPVRGLPNMYVRTVAREPHIMVEALTASPDALRRNRFTTAQPGRPYRAVLRMSVDRLNWDRPPAS